MQGAVEFPVPSQSRSDGTGVVDAETSSATYTPFTSSQTAVPELEPPFSFDSCKGARPDGTHVNDELVQDGWSWWYRKYAPGDKVLEGLEGRRERRRKACGPIRGRCRRGSIGRQAREGFLSGSEVLLTLSPTYRKISQGNRACYLANYLCWPTVHPLLPLTLLYLDRLETALSQQDQFY
jgi:hypothetical protein